MGLRDNIRCYIFPCEKQVNEVLRRNTEAGHKVVESIKSLSHEGDLKIKEKSCETAT